MLYIYIYNLFIYLFYKSCSLTFLFYFFKLDITSFYYVLLATGAETLVNSGTASYPKGNLQLRAIKDLHRDHTNRSRALSKSLKRRIRAPVRSRTRDEGFLLCWWICSRLTNHPLFIFFYLLKLDITSFYYVSYPKLHDSQAGLLVFEP